MKAYLEKNKLWNEEMEKETVKTIRKDVLQALTKAEKEKKPDWQELFTDVYDTPTPALVEQQQELVKHMEKYPDRYDMQH